MRWADRRGGGGGVHWLHGQCHKPFRPQDACFYCYCYFEKTNKLLNLKLRLWATSQLPWRGAHGYGLFSEFLILAKGFVNCRIFLGYRIERKHKFHLFFQPSYSEILLWKLIMTKDSWKVRTVNTKYAGGGVTESMVTQYKKEEAHFKTQQWDRNTKTILLWSAL